jgi:hypothetical protein
VHIRIHSNAVPIILPPIRPGNSGQLAAVNPFDVAAIRHIKGPAVFIGHNTGNAAERPFWIQVFKYPLRYTTVTVWLAAVAVNYYI